MRKTAKAMALLTAASMIMTAFTPVYAESTDDTAAVDWEKGDNIKAIKEKGGRAVKLAVSGAFHTPYMKDASEELEKALKVMTINAPQTEIYANRTGKPYPQDTAQIIETIALQASSSVRFEDTLKNMWADGIDTFIEVGAGKTLTGFVKKTLPEAKMYTVTTVDALNEAIENIKAGE